ncbi:MAG: PRTRC system ThiF family protein [Deltaproteobacteria bacterium]|nr:PRTRC system ThiF family protein [Deltaproteobacteria bacterium]TLN02188.1 MAG: PRTRC system ThiF family protein [bacterium]
MRHTIYPQLLTRKVKVFLIGGGGNGSQVLSGLARLHLSLRSLGHPGGFDVTMFDPDTVSSSNIGRQLFYQTDVGFNKATVLVHRVNVAFGLDWKAWPRAWTVNFGRSLSDNHRFSTPDIIISCVDTAESRREIAKSLDGVSYSHLYWLDLGNDTCTGQVVLGEPRKSGDRLKRTKGDLRLPTVTELFPELLDPDRPESDTPTCSLAEALERQELFICQAVSTCALQMLWSLFRYGGVDFSAQFINLKNGVFAPLMVDPEKWKRFLSPQKKTPKSRGQRTIATLC